MSLVLSTSVHAAQKCENFAKSFAIRDYKSRTGDVPGSNGIEVDARLLTVSGEQRLFEVSIAGNNEDGDLWTVVYKVAFTPIAESSKCALDWLKTEDLE